MINAITKQYDHYLSIGFQNFSEKLIAVFGLLQLMDYKGEGNFDEDDKQRLRVIERLTTQEVRVPLYVLDRVVYREQESRKAEAGPIGKRKHRFRRREVDHDSPQEIDLTEDEIRGHLCMAIREVHEIMSRNMAPYKIERALKQHREHVEDGSIIERMEQDI